MVVATGAFDSFYSTLISSFSIILYSECLPTTNPALINQIPPIHEFERFAQGNLTTIARNDIHWNPITCWINESRKGTYDSLHLYALDRLSCPAMATECERVLSAAKRILTPERNALGSKVIEACECLRWWWRTGVVSGRSPACPPTPRAEIEAGVVTTLLGNALGEQDVE